MGRRCLESLVRQRIEMVCRIRCYEYETQGRFSCPQGKYYQLILRPKSVYPAPFK
jgi:hypothetical protein